MEVSVSQTVADPPGPPGRHIDDKVVVLRIGARAERRGRIAAARCLVATMGQATGEVRDIGATRSCPARLQRSHDGMFMAEVR